MAAAAAAAAAAMDGGDGGGGSGRSGSHVTQVGRRTNPSRSRMIYFAHVSGHGYLRPRNVSREPDVRVEAVRICGETRAVLADFNEKAPFVDGCAASAVTRQALPDCQCCLRRAPESRHVQLRGDTERCSDSFFVTDRRHRQAKVADTEGRKARRWRCCRLWSLGNLRQVGRCRERRSAAAARKEGHSHHAEHVARRSDQVG